MKLKKKFEFNFVGWIGYPSIKNMIMDGLDGYFL
jgi:hypothetical protein